MGELFVYYRVRAADAPVARVAVLALQARLRQMFPGLHARLLQRSGPPGEAQTWMETYAFNPLHGARDITLQIQQEIESQARCVTDHIDGARHVEVFVQCDAST